MNELLKRYLEIKGKHHTNINEFWCELLNETKGKICDELVKNGFKTLNELNQFLIQNQLPKIKEGLE